MNPSPPPWSRSGQEPEPETTPDGLPIIRGKHGRFYVENGVMYPWYSPREQAERATRLMDKGPPPKPAPPWSPWDV